MYELLDSDSFNEIRISSIYPLLVDICRNIYGYLCIPPPGKRNFNCFINLPGAKIKIADSKKHSYDRVSISSGKIITDFFVYLYADSPNPLNPVFNNVYTFFGIDLDRVPELIEINNQLVEKIKQQKDSELYEKDKIEALRDLNTGSFRRKLKDICTILKE